MPAGIRPETYDASMAGIRRDPRVEELNRKQPEFIKPVWQYLDTAVSPARVANGQAMLSRYGEHARERAKRGYGVPKEILVAIWGNGKRLRRRDGRLQHVRGAGDARL